MYTKRLFPAGVVIRWTLRHILLFLFLPIIPVFLFDVLELKWLHAPWLPLGVLGTAVAFIIGFKNNASYDRLWEARKIWGGIVNSSRSWTIMVKDFITNDYTMTNLSKEEIEGIIKELVYRHIAWLTALRYQLREDRPWEMHLKKGRSNLEFKAAKYRIREEEISLEDKLKKYLSKEDYDEVMAKGNRASQILGIQSRRLKELMDRGLIEDFRHMEMANMLVEFYTLQGQCERIKNFPYPRQFATLNYWFVWIFILFLPYGLMEEFEAFGAKIFVLLDKHPDQTSTIHQLQEFIALHFVWFTVPFSALISWVYHTMEMIGENTENPFEGGPNDVPITDLCRSIEIDIRELIDDTDIPKPYNWVNNIVM
ncbi:bestrophin family protein [Cognatitamlana onchidii]|uniref:bestrophin family protein n=1 Tax=Cognatitamlana onchidii TaxID=2562860 RepID=UPI0010A681DB|nr:bestrophin family ion channel [Algibacter onchidii]